MFFFDDGQRCLTRLENIPKKKKKNQLIYIQSKLAQIGFQL